MSIVDIAISSGMGAITVAMVSGFLSSMKNQKELIRQMGHLSKMDILRAEDWEAVAKVQRPMLSGIKASLEAARDGKCNGNVTTAHADLTEGIKEYDSYLATLIRRGK